MKEPIDHKRFIELLQARFPQVANSIDECRQGLLHCEMGHFSHVTNDAIRAAEWDTVRLHFVFVDEVFKDAAPDVKNAVCVSFLENINFRSKHGQHARSILSSRLKIALAELEEYLEKLFRKKG